MWAQKGENNKFAQHRKQYLAVRKAIKMRLQLQMWNLWNAWWISMGTGVNSLPTVLPQYPDQASTLPISNVGIPACFARFSPFL
jgi:hypothetical protein